MCEICVKAQDEAKPTGNGPTRQSGHGSRRFLKTAMSTSFRSSTRPWRGPSTSTPRLLNAL
jgi:hypothetical protein